MQCAMPATVADGLARAHHCSLRVRKENTTVSAEGRTTHGVGHDPRLAASGGGISCSLQAGWSLADGRLTVFADRLGIIPIYYQVGDREIAVSDSLENLARLSTNLEIDLFEVYAFLKFGVYLGSATPLAGVRRLRPAETLVWEDGRVTHVQPAPNLAPYEGTRREAIAEVNRIFAEAVRRRIHNHLRQIVPLSGGRDSRHILLELTRQRAQGLQAVTVRYMRDYHEDVRVGSLLARALSVPHVVLANDHRHHFRHLAEQISANQFETTFHGWMRAMTARFPGRDWVFFDGLAGDALLNSAYARVLPAGMFESVQSGDVERMADTFAGNFDPPKYLRRLPDPRSFARKLKSRLIDEISRHKDAPDVMRRFMFEHRTRRATSIGPIATFGRSGQVCLPYLDEDLVNFAYRLSASEYWRPGLHDEAIAHQYPEFSHIPFENIGLRAQSRIGWRLQLWLVFGCVPLLFRYSKPAIVKRFHSASRFLYCCLRLKMSEYLYIAEAEAYFQTLLDHASARRKGRPGRGALYREPSGAGVAPGSGPGLPK